MIRTAIFLFLLFVLAFSLRFYRVGQPVFKEDEFTTVKAAAYAYQCQRDLNQCRRQPTSFKNRLLNLMTANETVPNLGAEIYLWDFIKDRASEIHHSRAWSHLYLVGGVYRWLGINELSSRLVSVVAGSLLVVVGYWFSRTFGGSAQISLLYSGLLAISFPLIDFSRNARMYSLYTLVFLLLVTMFYKRKWLAAGILFLLAYWLQMLTLILPLSLLAWAVWEKRYRLAGGLLFGMLILAGLSQYFNLDFSQRQFLALAWPPHWQYLNWWLAAALVLLVLKRQKYLLTIILTYLLVLVFFTRPAPAAAYTLALGPLILWPFLNWRRWLRLTVALIVLIQFAIGINYLYFGRDGRAQINRAYPVLTNKFQSGDKIYAVQLRDYYLQDLPPETEVIDLQENPQGNFSGSGFVVWEKEKAVHLQPSVLAEIQASFHQLGGQGLDGWGVEIYSFGK